MNIFIGVKVWSDVFFNKVVLYKVYCYISNGLAKIYNYTVCDY